MEQKRSIDPVTAQLKEKQKYLCICMNFLNQIDRGTPQIATPLQC